MSVDAESYLEALIAESLNNNLMGQLSGTPSEPLDNTELTPDKFNSLDINAKTKYAYDAIVNNINLAKQEGRLKPGEDLNALGILGQILFETGNFKSSLASKYFNFGGHKADRYWKEKGGDFVSIAPNKSHIDLYEQNEELVDWRVYPNLQSGLKAKVDFFINNSRYRKNGVMNAKTPAQHLLAVQKAGYAGTEANYADLALKRVNDIPKYLESYNAELKENWATLNPVEEQELINSQKLLMEEQNAARKAGQPVPEFSDFGNSNYSQQSSFNINQVPNIITTPAFPAVEATVPFSLPEGPSTTESMEGSFYNDPRSKQQIAREKQIDKLLVTTPKNIVPPGFFGSGKSMFGKGGNLNRSTVKNYYPEGGELDNPTNPSQENYLNSYFQNMLNSTGLNTSRRRGNTFKWDESVLNVNPRSMSYDSPLGMNLLSNPVSAGVSLQTPLKLKRPYDRDIANHKGNEGWMFEAGINTPRSNDKRDYIQAAMDTTGFGSNISAADLNEAYQNNNLESLVQQSINDLKQTQQEFEEYRKVNPYNEALYNPYSSTQPYYEPGDPGYDQVMRWEEQGKDFYKDDTDYFNTAISDSEKLLKQAKLADKFKYMPTLTAGFRGIFSPKQGGYENLDSNTSIDVLGQIGSQGIGADASVGLRGEKYFGRTGYGGQYEGGAGMLGIKGDVGFGGNYNPFFNRPDAYVRGGIHGTADWKPANWWPGYLSASAGLTGRVGTNITSGAGTPFRSVSSNTMSFTDPRNPESTYSYNRYQTNNEGLNNWKAAIKPYFNIAAKFPIKGNYRENYHLERKVKPRIRFNKDY